MHNLYVSCQLVAHGPEIPNALGTSTSRRVYWRALCGGGIMVPCESRSGSLTPRERARIRAAIRSAVLIDPSVRIYLSPGPGAGGYRRKLLA